jgi:hypothetical protein
MFNGHRLGVDIFWLNGIISFQGTQAPTDHSPKAGKHKLGWVIAGAQHSLHPTGGISYNEKERVLCPSIFRIVGIIQAWEII